MTVNLKILHYLVFVSLLVACNAQQREELKYVEFIGKKKSPFISIISETNSQCEYLVNFVTRHPDTSFSDKAIMYLQGDKFLFKTLNPNSEEFCLFDLNQDLNSIRNIEISYEEDSFKGEKQIYTVILENKLKSEDNLEVYVYRLKDFFYYMPDNEIRKLDVVVFITQENGVIGSYISSISKDTEIVIYPAGNILEEQIDYKNKQRATLK
jgi:hypothetical protein